MKRAFLTGMSFIVGMTSVTAYSQTPPVGVSVIGGVNGGTTGFLSAGQYDIKNIQQDNTKVFEQAIGHLKDMQKIDREYLNEINARLLSGTKGLIDLARRFNEMSQAASMGTVALEDYLKLINQIRQAEQNFTAELDSLTLVTRETLPSQTSVSIGEMRTEIGSAGNINMAPVSQRFAVLRDNLMRDMNGLKFPFIVTKLNQRITISENSLTPNLQGLQIMTADEIRAKTDEMQELLSLDGSTTRLQVRYIERLRNDIRGFVEDYGTEEAFRFRDENDRQAKIQGFQLIQDSFYRRSYLRRKYGIPMGALRTTQYKKSIANIEKFTESFRPLSEYLTMIEPQPAIQRAEVMKAFESARNFVQMYDEKVTPIFSKDAAAKRAANQRPALEENASYFDKIVRAGQSSNDWVSSQFAGREEIMSQADKKLEYSSADTGFLVRANSAITFLTGRQPTAEVMLAVMRMVLADAREELMLLQNDRAALQAYHNQRFQATSELKSDSLKRICQMDFTLSDATHKANCVPLGVTYKASAPRGQPGSDISGIFLGLLNQYQMVEAAKSQQAENIRQLVAAARAAGVDAEEQQSQEDDLFK